MTSLYAYSAYPYYAFPPILILLSLLLTAPLSATRHLQEPRHRRQVKLTEHGTTWHPFSRLVDSERGAHVPALSDLKRYLHRFGYLPDTPGGNLTDLFDEGLESALSLYQSNLGLPVTGRLDAATVSQLSLPRCGDTDGAGAAHASTKFAFFSGKPSWDRAPPFTLTYAFERGAGRGKLDEEEVRGAFARAFRRWAEVIPVKFEEKVGEHGKADIRIGFYKGEHGDGEPFDGVLGILAHAFSPENGRLHLDAAETWAVDFHRETSPAAVHLESVATHEIGHVLGLGHSSVKEAVMYPNLSPRRKKLDLRFDDIKGVQALYGSNPDFSLASLAQTYTSPAGPRFHGGQRWSEIVTVAVMTAVLRTM